MDYGIDTNRTFGLKDLIIFTDFLVIPNKNFRDAYSQRDRICKTWEGDYPCLASGKKMLMFSCKLCVVNNLNKWVYMPFGAGPRMCIGNAFAMMESQIILSIISKQFQLNLRREIPVEFESGITLRPKNEMLMDVIKR